MISVLALTHEDWWQREAVKWRRLILPAEAVIAFNSGRSGRFGWARCIECLDRDLGDLSPTYGFADALIYVAYTIPRRIEEFIPYATLIGSLIGLGRLAASSELIVIRTAGVSMRRVGWMAIKPALFIAFFGMAIGEYIAPVSEQIAISQRALAQRDDLIWRGATAHGTAMATRFCMLMRCSAVG